MATKFRLSCEVTVSAITVVEADSLDEAIAAAEERQVVLTFTGSGADEGEEWLVEEADGTPTNIRAA